MGYGATVQLDYIRQYGIHAKLFVSEIFSNKKGHFYDVLIVIWSFNTGDYCQWFNGDANKLIQEGQVKVNI